MAVTKSSLEWLSTLISFDTTSRFSNVELIHVIANWFKAHNITPLIIHNTAEQKANLFASLPDVNGKVEGGLILSGHTDVVPVDGQEWKTNPFEAVQIGDRLYGRGAADMKGFIAVVLALLPEFKKTKLSQPLHFAFSYDEEVGCHGAVALIEKIAECNIHPEACIVGEPTEMRPIVAHKGINLFRCRIKGNAVHSSLTTSGCNAIEYAAELICWARRLADEFKQTGPFDNDFDVQHTSVSTNLIKGGNAFNTIPSECEFYFEFRNLPTDKAEQINRKIQAYIQNELLPKMKKEYVDASVELDTIAAVPSFEASEEAEITKLLRRVTGEGAIAKVAYATEAGMFQNAGIPTIVCGPGSIEQAHKANEFIEIAQLGKCEEFLRTLIR